MTSLLGKAVRTVRPRNLVTGPPDYAGRQGSFFSSVSTDGPSEAQMAGYGTSGTLFSVVSRLATATSKVEWKLWRKARTGVEQDRVEVTVHPALNVWLRPNDFYTRNRFVETVQQHCDLTGEQRWVVVRADGVGRSLGPMELWPVRPDRITPVASRTEFIAGYIYTSPSGEKVPLEVDDVISVLMPNPLDPYRGLGPTQSILVELDSSRYTAEWNRNFFINSAMPGGVVETPLELSDPEFEQFNQRWREQHKGVNNAYRVAILENGAKWVPNTFTQRDMQFVELRQVSRDAIREAFGIPKFALGDVDDVNRATAEASGALFAEQLTEPRLDRIKEALNFQFLPMFYPGGWRTVDVEFDYVSPVPPNLDKENANLAANVSAATALVTSLGTDPAATLEAFNLPAIPIAAPEEPQVSANPDSAPTPADEAMAQADVLAKIVSGTGTVVHFDEGRALLARAGWPIDPFRPPPEPPEPQTPAPGGAPGSGGAADDTTADDAPGGQTPVDALGGRPPRPHGSIINTLLDTPNLYASTHSYGADAVPVAGARRPYNSIEIRAQVDAGRIDDDWQNALTAVMAAYEDAVGAQRLDLADAVRHIVTGGDLAALLTLSVSSSDVAAVLLDALTTMATDGAAQVVAEALAQGAAIEAAPADHAALSVVATVTAGMLAQNLATSAAREAWRWLGYGRTGDEVGQAVAAHLATLSPAPVRAVLGHALMRAQNMARADTLQRAVGVVPVTFYASEILDGNTCLPCRKIDGQELPTPEAMILAYGGGPYLGCLGTIRCRGMAIGVFG